MEDSKKEEIMLWLLLYHESVIRGIKKTLGMANKVSRGSRYDEIIEELQTMTQRVRDNE